ncbi:MAG: ComEC/Rec2 family competence protein [Myxococcota bacterium]|nr:ComEC/Rec2 family competence protein [Myxococcota bacterium]
MVGVLLVSSPRSNSQGRWARFASSLSSSVQISAATTLMTAPLCALIWGRVPLAGLWVNLVAIPLLGMATVPPLVVGAAAGLLSPALAVLPLQLAALPARTGLLLVEIGARPELSPLIYWEPREWQVLALYGTLLAALLLFRGDPPPRGGPS